MILDVPPAKAWAIVGDFQDMSWDRRIVSATGSGGNAPEAATRRVTLGGGAIFGESLYKYDPAAMSYSYHIDTIDVRALPVQNVSATLEVSPVDGNKSRIVWRGAFYRYLRPDEGAPDAADAAARDAVAAYFRSGLNGLAARLEPKNVSMRGAVSALVLVVTLVSLVTLSPRTAAADEAWITDQNGDAVSVVDLAARKVVATIDVAGKPAGVAMAHDGRRAYVSSTNGKTIRAIDTASRKVVASLPVPDEVVGIAVGRDDRFVYAVGFFAGQMFKIDAATLTIVASAPIGGTPSGIVVTPDGKTLVITKRDADRLALVDSGSLAVEAEVPVGRRPYGVTVDAEGRRAYTANVYGDDVSVVDLAARKLVGTVPVGKRPYVVALADGKGFVTDQYEGKVAVFDLATLQPITRIPVGSYPDGIQAGFDGRRVYSVNWESDSLSEIDTTTLKVVATIPVGDSPRGFGTFLRRTP